jgi:hypothetical protein
LVAKRLPIVNIQKEFKTQLAILEKSRSGFKGFVEALREDVYG